MYKEEVGIAFNIIMVLVRLWGSWLVFPVDNTRPLYISINLVKEGLQKHFIQSVFVSSPAKV